MPGWIAYDLALHCAEPDGRVHPRMAFFDHAVRAALLVDLTFRGRIDPTRESDWLDTTATQFAPADALVDFIAAHPSAPLRRAVTSAPVTMADVLGLDPRELRLGTSAATMFRQLSGSISTPGLDLQPTMRDPWTPDVDLDAMYRTTAFIAAIIESGAANSPERAALAALAAATTPPRERRDDLIRKSGAATAIVGDCVAELLAFR